MKKDADKWARLSTYLESVRDCIVWQLAEIGCACPAFLTITEPADAFQAEHVQAFLELRARERFGVPPLEIRIDHGQSVH
jgi:hypothetical protein